MNSLTRRGPSAPALDLYLAAHFLDEPRFASCCGVSVEALSGLVADRLVPGPSYVISPSFVLSSPVFQDLEAPGSAPGRYHRPEHAVWVARARAVIAETGREGAQDRLKARFIAELLAAAEALDATWDPPVVSWKPGWGDEAWESFLKGTYGLCVADPGSESAIARKEALQARLVKLSYKGARTRFQEAEAVAALALIEAYAEAAMPFSPLDYPLSSRKLLVDDLRPRVERCLPGTRSLP